MELQKRLLDIQAELKAPKDKRNSFGNYNYRSAESILEAVKPLLKKHECLLTLEDTIVYIGERFYVQATATIRHKDEEIRVSAFAREDETKKGMDGSQITGTSSSYARKYALNGLFCIDDTKDADTDEYHKQTSQKKVEKAEKPQELTNRDKVMILADEKGISPKELAKDYKLTKATTEERFAEVLKDLEGR